MEAKFGLIFGHCCGLQERKLFLLVYIYFIEVLHLMPLHISGTLNTLMFEFHKINNLHAF